MKENSDLQLSVIVPVYNVEKYIRTCIESIYNQGLDEDTFEVIIVNDGTQDIIDSHKNITIINQENQGLSMARNNGMAIARGDYLLMPDSDDLLVENSVKPLLEKALETKADMVIGDYIELKDCEIDKYVTQPQTPDFSYQEKSSEDMYVNDFNPTQSFVWRTLYKRSFIADNHIQFVPGIYYQDIPFTNECYILAKKCIKYQSIIYIYRNRKDSTTNNFNVTKSRQNAFAISKAWNLKKRHQLSHRVNEKLQNNVWVNLNNLQRRICHLSIGFNEREKIFDYIRQTIPDLYFRNSKKQRLFSYLFWHWPLLFNLMRYYYILTVEDIILPYYHQQIIPKLKCLRTQSLYQHTKSRHTLNDA